MLLFLAMVNYGRSKLLRRTLESFYDTTDTKKTNIVLVDNGSKDPVRNVINDYAMRLNHIILLKENKGKPYGLNLAYDFIKETHQSEYVMFCDSDLEFMPGWYDKMISAFITFEKIDKIGTLSGFSFKKESMEQLHHNGKQINIQFNPPGCTVMMNSKVFEKIGRWNESRLIRTVDTSYYKTVRAAGYKTAVMPYTVIDHTGVEQRSWESKTAKPIYFD